MAKSKSTKETTEYANQLQKAFGPPNMDLIEKATTQFESREAFDSAMYWRSGLIPMDLLSGGYGVPKGRLVHYWCENGIGKTTSYYAWVRSLIAYAGISVWWMGFEPSEKLALDMGLLGPNALFPKEKFRYLPGLYYSDLEAYVKAFVTSDADIAVIDSFTAVTPSPDTVKEKGALEKATVGSGARIESSYLKHIHAWCQDTGKTILYITQARNKIATKPWQKSGLFAAGSEASGFFSDIRISMRGARKITTKDAGLEGTQKVVGTQGWIFAEKSRHSEPMVKIPITVLFGQGVSNLTAMREFLLWDGSKLLQGGAGWYTLSLGGTEQKVQGVPALHEAIRPHQKEILDLFYSGRNEAYFNHWQEESNYDDA